MQETQHLQGLNYRSTQPTKNTETLSKFALITPKKRREPVLILKNYPPPIVLDNELIVPSFPLTLFELIL
jgi:hypothetical protein